MSVLRSEQFSYPSVPLDVYKDEPGTWVSVTRRVLTASAKTSFETRFFEIAAGGYTSFERHEHEHVVVVTRGQGRVRLGDEWSEIGEGDFIHVPQNTPHQFTNESNQPFGIVCIVDRDRDRPVLLDTDGLPRASEK